MFEVGGGAGLFRRLRSRRSREKRVLSLLESGSATPGFSERLIELFYVLYIRLRAKKKIKGHDIFKRI